MTRLQTVDAHVLYLHVVAQVLQRGDEDAQKQAAVLLEQAKQIEEKKQ